MSSKIQDLTATTSAASSDVFIVVTDPAGTPADKKITTANLKTSLDLSGTNSGDDAVNSNYASDYRLANFVAGTDYLAPTGSAAGLTSFPTLNQDTTGKSAKTDALNSATTIVNVSSATAPTTGQVLTATDSTHATWQDPAGGSVTPSIMLSTLFETSTRFGGAASGAGSARTFDTNGLNLSTGNSVLGYAHNYLVFPALGYATAEVGSPTFSTSLGFFPGTDVFLFFGIGNFNDISTGTGDGYTSKHIGIKITRASSGNTVVTATQADGSTENTTTLIANFTGSYLDLIIKVNSTSSVDYYYRIDGGALSSATNLTSNLPSGVNGNLFHFIKNKTVTSNSDAYIASMSYSR